MIWFTGNEVIGISIGTAVCVAITTITRDLKWRKVIDRILANHDASQAVSDARIKALSENQKAFYETNEELNAIALFLRNNYANEIKQGYHQGRTVSAIVTGYLAVERAKTSSQVPLVTQEFV